MRSIILFLSILISLVAKAQNDTMGCFCLRENKLFITIKNTSDTILELPNRIRGKLAINHNIIRGEDFIKLTISHDSLGGQTSIVTPTYTYTPGIFGFIEVAPKEDQGYVFYVDRVYRVKKHKINKVFIYFDRDRIFLFQYRRECHWKTIGKRRHIRLYKK